MKKKFLSISLMAVIALAASWSISQNENEVSLVNLALSDVEALACTEDYTGPNGECNWSGERCYLSPYNQNCTYLYGY
ncbi:NVEALA domain-containing protein [Parabacteroides sp. OttesenSCG-928-G07]|nr:NVEALA domain-containing protein [Parabacteroides sp. OttesenSCG-928-G07]